MGGENKEHRDKVSSLLLRRARGKGELVGWLGGCVLTQSNGCRILPVPYFFLRYTEREMVTVHVIVNVHGMNNETEH